ncbi:MAG: thiamine-phosphate kinase [Bacillota bacterium]|uniref:Thiamine-monophosphate kinase n=4 Tax=Carboxydocella TaxID=178898 RepID=A0A1T4RZ08_9FIRM|nr:MULTISPECIES: thiamine-phosphate kinase [Carboxydocella]AVX21403.1 thiamine-monophosphate kinase [Carboxydocella thermautotrophica]AVX31892.1 thiamine-monophosphate kinase [Carboxydocella thermautotrophica]SKA20938.1 thiamine-monophosphate kinase [Carboxydocella sporoproducens DSM 16521]
MKIAELGEFGLIEYLTRNWSPGLVGDDAAWLPLPPGEQGPMLFTTDMMLEEVHFSRRFSSAYDIGWKAVAVNVSDIAAMGGEPWTAVISLGADSSWSVAELEELYAGMQAAAEIYGVVLAGGDTVKSRQGLILNLALTGWQRGPQPLGRDRARPGQLLAVTGPLGASAAGLAWLQAGGEGDCATQVGEAVTLHRRPRAQLAAGRWLAERQLATAANDISDGLAREVLEICTASGVGCQVEATAIPIHAGARSIARTLGKDALEWAFRGGEDFQLLFTCAEADWHQIETGLTALGCQPARIGRITPPEQGMRLLTEKGPEPWPAGGYDHFTGGKE